MSRRNNGPRLHWLTKRQTWYIVWSENGRSKQHSTGTQIRGEAEIKLAEWLRGRQLNNEPKEPRKILITDILTDYIDDRGARVKDSERLVYAIVPLIKFWQGKTVNDITRQSCDAYTNFRNRAAGTIRRELGTLRAAINHAVGERRLIIGVKVHLPPKPPSKERFLTKSEAALLLKASLKAPKASQYLSLFILIALHTGQRKEAVLSLRWHQIDFQSRMIQWNPEGRQQTNKKRPRSRIPSKLVRHLKHAQLRGSDLGHVIHIDGKRIKDLKKSFKEACDQAGLEGVTPHTLRHTRATWGMQAGTPIWELAQFLGMSVQTLERVYAHHHPEYQKLAAENY